MSDANRRKFVAALAKLVSPLDAATASASIAAMLPGLTMVPDAAFLDPGMLAIDIGQQFTRCPSYAQLLPALEKWWEEHKPKVAALAGPGVDALTEDDKARIRNWQLHVNARDRSSAEMKRHLDTTRRLRPYAYRWLIANDDEAGRVASLAGWDVEHRTSEAAEQAMRDDWGSITEEGVRRKLDAVIATGLPVWLDALRAAIGKYAPQHLHLLPDRMTTPPRPGAVPRSHPVREQQEAVTPPPSPPSDDRPGMRPIPEMTPERKRAFLAELRADPRYPNRAVRIRRICEELGMPALPTDPVPEPQEAVRPPEPPPAPEPANDAQKPQRAAAAATPKAPRWVGPWSSVEEPAK